MNPVPLNRKVILDRLAEIREDLEKLNSFCGLSANEFRKGENFAIAEHYLRRCLEAVFDLANHILSRFSFTAGERPTTYKELALALGEKGILPKDFASNILLKMAGYRNRLTHFYSQVTDKEMLQIITNNLKDIKQFAIYIRQLLERPDKYRLSIK